MKNVAKWWQFSIQIRDLEPWHLSDIADRLFCESERLYLAAIKNEKKEWLGIFLYFVSFSIWLIITNIWIHFHTLNAKGTVAHKITSYKS